MCEDNCGGEEKLPQMRVKENELVRKVSHKILTNYTDIIVVVSLPLD